MKQYNPSIYYKSISQDQRLAAIGYLARKEMETKCDISGVCMDCIYKETCQNVAEIAADEQIPYRPSRKTMQRIAEEILKDLYEETDGYESYCYDQAISAIEDIDD